MPRVLITHGRGQAFQIPGTMERDWVDALRFGLEAVGVADPRAVDIDFAFYGDIWRPDRRALGGDRGDDADRGDDEEERGPVDDTAWIAAAQAEPPSQLEGAIANELVPIGADEERLDWERFGAIVKALDDAFGVGELVLTRFLKDLDEYFGDPEIRSRTLDKLRAACRDQTEPVLLLGHSMGSIVAYDVLATDGADALGVVGLVTFGSPLGMRSLRRRVDLLHSGTPYPTGLPAWSNVYNPEDFATAVRELAPLYQSADAPRVRDVVSMGRAPSVTDPGRGHDPTIYLSSIGLAREVRSMLEADGRGAGPEPIVVGDAAVAPAQADVPPTDALPPPPIGAPPARRSPGGIIGRVTRGLRGMRASGDNADVPTHSAPPSAPSAPAPPPAPGADQDERGGELPAPPPERAVDAGTRTVERTASADFPPIVAPGSTHDLIFSIAGVAVHAVSTGISLTAPVDQTTLELRVGVYAADFDIAAVDDPSRTWTSVIVDLDDASKPAEGRFKLTAHAVEGRRETPIYLTFYRGNLPVGQLSLLTAIDPVHDVRRAAISLSFDGAPDPDYVLVVSDRSDGMKGAGPFDISVSKEGEFINKPLGSFPVAIDAWDYASRRLDGFRRVKDETETADRVRAAENLGVEIWNDLPEAFQRFYWEELHPRPGASIAIYSQEPYIPWELIKPQRGPGDADGFLGAVFNIARWKQATRFPDPLAVSGFSIIAPVYTPESGNRPLPGAQAEADELADAFGARKISGDRKTVRALLESEDGVQIIHFAGHGDFDPNDSAAMTIIRLSDAPLVPADLTQATIGRASRPFVFLNACEVGEQGWALTRIGGWAEAFTDVGFSGFVGPYWAVNDKVARKAAVLFYRSLAAGVTVAEAIRQIRLRFYSDEEHAGHPSWLAYTLHCQPNIRISLKDVAQPGGTPVSAGGPR